MVGQAALRACLQDPDVTEVLSIGRHSSSQRDAKLRELVVPDLFDLSSIDAQLSGYDACLYCLGVSSAGMSEVSYRHITYDLTLSIAQRLLARSPSLTFIYVTGSGTDTRGSAMWARVKGDTEQALLALGFKAAYMFRPAFIQPQHGVRSRTWWYHAIYRLTAPIYPLLARTKLAAYMTTSDQLGHAFISVAKRGAPKSILEPPDINAIT